MYLIIFSIFVALAAVIGAGLFFGRERVLAGIFGSADLGRTDFKTLRRSSRRKSALICPEDFCNFARPDMIAPVFGMSASELRERLRASLKNEARLERIHTNDAAMRERYVQRSEVFRFPDTIQVEYIAIDNKHSTLALFSRAQLGISDGKVNFRRVQRWLKRLDGYITDAN